MGALLAPQALIAPVVSVASIVFLAALGAVGAKAGGAPIGKAVVRVTFWGALALGATAAVGALFGVAA